MRFWDSSALVPLIAEEESSEAVGSNFSAINCYSAANQPGVDGAEQLIADAEANGGEPEVYNATNDPVLVDRLVREAYGRGLVTEDDMKAWSGHLETRINRVQQRSIAAQSHQDALAARNESRLVREQGDVEKFIDIATAIGEDYGSPHLAGASRDTRAWAYERMNKDVYEGKMLPMDWWMKLIGPK